MLTMAQMITICGFVCMPKKKFAINQDILYRHVSTGENFSADSLKAYESDKEMAGIILEEYSQVLDDSEKKLISEAPEKNLRRRYNGQMKGDILFHLLSALISAQSKGKTLDSYLYERGIHSVAIYGAGLFGESICGIICGGDVSVRYFIDRNADFIQETIPVIKPDDVLKNVCDEKYGKVDAVLMTLVSRDEKTEKFISERLQVPVLNMRSIVSEMVDYV